MINKKSIWFLTMFSLILVLSVYYITMPSELLVNNNFNEEEIEPVISESSILVALRVDALEDLQIEMELLQSILTNNETTTEEKNEAFSKMKSLNDVRATEELIESVIKSQLDYESFAKITGDQIEIVIQSTNHDNDTATKIMRLVQEQFENKMYITVRFTN